MTNAQRLEKLRQAQQQLEAVRDSFDDHGTTCSSCTTFRYTNWQEHLLKQQLSGFIEKLDNLARKIAFKEGV